MKTSELTGATLDWAVAKCENFYTDGFSIIRVWNKRVTKIIPGDYETGEVYTSYSPSSDWSQGGPIIEREELSIAKLEETLPDAVAPHPACWSGHIDGVFVRYGPTPLIAAMRCYVASKLGDTVDLPPELA